MKIFWSCVTLVLTFSGAYAHDVPREHPQAFRLRPSHALAEDKQRVLKGEIAFGRGIAAKLLGKYELVRDEALNEYVSKLGAAIAANVGRGAVQYYFGVVRTEDVNAYATSGGYIFVTLGALRLMEDEAQLVGVLAHEISHDTRRHIVRKLDLQQTSEEQSLLSSLNVVSLTLRTALERLNDLAYQLLTEQGLPQNDEFEADADAVTTLSALGYQPQRYLAYLKKAAEHAETHAADSFSQTHPSTPLRLAQLRALLAQKDISPHTGITNQARFEEYVQLATLSARDTAR